MKMLYTELAVFCFIINFNIALDKKFLLENN